MTEDTVNISIAIKVENKTHEFQKSVPISAIEEGVQTMAVAVGQEVMRGVISELDVRMAGKVPDSWVNAGTEERWLVCSLGAVRYKRRVYLDEQRKRQKPMDDVLGCLSIVLGPHRDPVDVESPVLRGVDRERPGGHQGQSPVGGV